MCVSECMCIPNMIHLWWIKPAVSIERWPRTPCTGGNRRCKRPLSAELPNIAWPSTDHCAMLSTEVTIGQICSHNNGRTLYFFRETSKTAHRHSSNATGNQVTLNKNSLQHLYHIQWQQNPTKCFYSDRNLGCVCDTQCVIMMSLSYFMPFFISYDIIDILYMTECT